ncbi:hypothetical protein MTP99_001757 [Tenebrio molitor]|nr:hypothetical protein MTP99_001757 [Tenebrio molitor]
MMECWEKRTVPEKKSLVTLIAVLASLTALITLILLVSEPQYCHNYSCIKSSEQIYHLIDLNEPPCHNFYNFACGNISNRSRQSIVDDAKTASFNKLKQIISEAVSVDDTKTLRLQKQFYRSCRDLAAIEADNDTTFWGLITQLGGWPVVSGNNWNESSFDFGELMVNLREVGLQHDWFLDIFVYSNLGESTILEINVPDNANKIEEEVKEEYVALMVETAVAFGAYEDVAKAQMPEVMYFENKLANLIDAAHNENEVLYGDRPLQLLTIAEVQLVWQNINWLELLNQITKKKLSEGQQVAFYVKNYMRRLDKLLKETTKRTQVNYVIWKLVEAYSPFLSERVRDLSVNYLASTNQSDLWYKDRDAFCFEESKSSFQYSLEAAYLRRYVPEATRKHVEEIIERIMDQVEEHLHKADWLDSTTRTAAISKLQNTSYIIGGPEEMYYAEQFDKDFGAGNMKFNSTNIIHILNDVFHNEFDRLYNTNKEETNYLKYTFYEQVLSQETKFVQHFNLIWVPAGVLHDFFYEENRPNYLNYGTIGSLIAQDLIYSVYSEIFRNSTWHKAFDCMGNCTDDLNFKVDCTTDNLFENLVNYIGVNLSYEAYKKWLKSNGPERKLPGLDFTNDQLFWLAYSSLMCHLPVLELNYNRSDHMIDSYKITGPFRNSPYFSRDFKCVPGSSMNPRNKCQML